MYVASLLLVFVIKLKCFSCLIGEAAEDVTTVRPMNIALLDNDDLCKFQPNEYDCGKTGKKQYRYYYDIKLEDCKATTIGDCEDNKNIFYDLLNCKDTCRDDGQHPVSRNLTPNIFCRFQPDFGLCYEYHPMWYYDVSTKACKGFSYSGCGGNQNKFRTAQDCTGTCVPAVIYERQL